MDADLEVALEYIERTARLLRSGEHPKPRRAVHLIAQHLAIVQTMIGEFPEDLL